MLHGFSKANVERISRVVRQIERRPQRPQQVRRRRPVGDGGGVDIRIFEIQSEADGDGVYNCYEQALDAEQWDDTNGDEKFKNKDDEPTEVDILNLAEYDPAAIYSAQLSTGDLLAAWQMVDDDKTSRWVGVALSPANNKHFGVILESISRGSITGTDPRATYLVKIDDEIAEDWVSATVAYSIDDRVTYDDRVWVAIKDHESHAAFYPYEGSPFWELWGEYEMEVLHWRSGTATNAVPWFQTNQVVEVAQYEGTWYIIATVINCVADGSYSIFWDEDKAKIKAVFA